MIGFEYRWWSRRSSCIGNNTLRCCCFGSFLIHDDHCFVINVVSFYRWAIIKERVRILSLSGHGYRLVDQFYGSERG